MRSMRGREFFEGTYRLPMYCSRCDVRWEIEINPENEAATQLEAYFQAQWCDGCGSQGMEPKADFIEASAPSRGG
jgi:hypothetical protein